MNVKRYVPKATYKPKKRIPPISNKTPQSNYNVLLENLENLDDNLKSDYVHSLRLLSEYFNHENTAPNKDVMFIITRLCTHLPIPHTPKVIMKQNTNEMDTKYMDQFCRFISLLCITHNIEWNKDTLNLFISTLIDKFISKNDILLSLLSYLPTILRSIGHVLFQRGNLINDTNRDHLISLLIPLCLAKNTTNNCIKHQLIQNIDTLCIERFSQNRNISTYSSSKEIASHINECNKNTISIHDTIQDVWKYHISLRKFSLIALGHLMIKCKSLFSDVYIELITSTMLITFHFLKRELSAYCDNKLCRNEHDFAKQMTPIVRSLSHLLNECCIAEVKVDDDDLIIQIIDDLKDLMVLGASDYKKETEQETTTTTSVHTAVSVDMNDYSKRDRHRYRNRVVLDWSGEEYIVNGYTSDRLLSSTEDIDKSFFIPFDVFSKLRMYIQHCLGLLMKGQNDTNANFSHFWNKLLPKDVNSAISRRPFYGDNIFTVLLYDPHPRVRNAACLTLYNLLEICAVKISHLLSKNKKKKRSLTTISDRAHETLLAMHRGLLFGIEEKEHHSTPRTQILKCLLLLVSMTDYHKLGSDGSQIIISIIACMTRDISQSQTHYGLQYKSALIQLLAASLCINNESASTEMNKLITDIMPILLQEIAKCTSPNPCCAPRCILVSLASHYRWNLSLWWNKGLKEVIHSGFGIDQHYTITLETMKIIHSWCNTMKVNCFNDYDDAMFGFFKLSGGAKNLGFWLNKFISHLNTSQSPDSAAIKSKICCLLAALKSWHFNLFEDAVRVLLLQFLCDCLNDAHYPSLRQCSCRAVGNLLSIKLNKESVYYKIMFKHLLDIIHSANTDTKLKKQHYLLVSKACCAVSNICHYNDNNTDVKQLFIYNSETNANDMIKEEEEDKENEEEEEKQVFKYPASEPRMALIELVGDDLLISMMNALLSMCNRPKHNISYNSIRALGHIAYWIPINKSKCFTALWGEICGAFSQSLSNENVKLKNQWNTCFAAGAALSNGAIPTVCDVTAMEATKHLYGTIFKLLDKCDNYKVKITAVYALTCPVSRKNYGPKYYKLIHICCNSLNNIDELECNGFAKQKYKQLLKFRLIRLLAHLCNLFYSDNAVNTDIKKIAKLKSAIKLNDQNILKYCLAHHEK